MTIFEIDEPCLELHYDFYSNEDGCLALSEKFYDACDFDELKTLLKDDIWDMYPTSEEYKEEWQDTLEGELYFRGISLEDFDDLSDDEKNDIISDVEATMWESFLCRETWNEERVLYEFCYWWLQENKLAIKGDNGVFESIDTAPNNDEYVHYYHDGKDPIVNSAQVAWGCAI